MGSVPGAAGEQVPASPGQDASLPVMPGFREMAQRRAADEQASLMAEERGRLVRELAGRRQAAVARLESGTADVRATTLERYAAAVGGQITWKLSQPGDGVAE